MLISVVVPVYEESDLVTRLHEELRGALDSLDTPWEIVYVNDGSRDDSLALLRKAQGTDARVAIVELSRNWGHQAALSAGLNVARGDAVVLIDGDLQDPPAVIPELVAAWREGAEVVIAERRSRVETGLRALLFPLSTVRSGSCRTSRFRSTRASSASSTGGPSTRSTSCRRRTATSPA